MQVLLGLLTELTRLQLGENYAKFSADCLGFGELAPHSNEREARASSQVGNWRSFLGFSGLPERYGGLSRAIEALSDSKVDLCA